MQIICHGFLQTTFHASIFNERQATSWTSLQACLWTVGENIQTPHRKIQPETFLLWEDSANHFIILRSLWDLMLIFFAVPLSVLLPSVPLLQSQYPGRESRPACRWHLLYHWLLHLTILLYHRVLLWSWVLLWVCSIQIQLWRVYGQHLLWKTNPSVLLDSPLMQRKIKKKEKDQLVKWHSIHFFVFSVICEQFTVTLFHWRNHKNVIWYLLWENLRVVHIFNQSITTLSMNMKSRKLSNYGQRVNLTYMRKK